MFQPISCDMPQQNATLIPKSVVSTSLLDGEMRQCDKSDGKIGCCPFGYGCDSFKAGGLGACRRLVEQGPNWDPDGEMEPIPEGVNTVPGGSASRSTSPPASTSFVERVSTMTTGGSTQTISVSQPVEATEPLADETNEAGEPINNSPLETGAPEFELPDTTEEESQQEEAGSRFPIEAILVGLFPGLAVGILLAIAAMCLLGARRRKAPKISSPALIGGSGNIRTDFIHSYQPSEQSKERPPERPPTAMGRVKSLFRKSNASAAQSYTRNGPRGLGLGLPISPAPVRPMHQQVPPMPDLKREPSAESINVFVDEGVAGRNSRLKQWETPGTTHTTFSDMMDRADLSDVSKNGYVLPKTERVSGMKLSPHTYTPGGSPAGSFGRANGRRLI